MPGHAQSSRRRRAWSIGRPLVFFAAAGGIAAWEAVRIADARATVVSGWAAGIAAGAGGGLVLAALVAVMALVQRQRPWSRRGRPRAVLILILTTVLLLVVAVLVSTPPRQYGPHPRALRDHLTHRSGGDRLRRHFLRRVCGGNSRLACGGG